MNILHSRIHKILLCIAVVWVAVVITATITTVCVKKSITQNTTKDAYPEIKNINTIGKGDAVFTGVGQIRAVTAKGEPEANTDEMDKSKSDGTADTGASVIVTAWFSYPKDDSAFFEEIASKSTLIRKTIQGYFAARTKEKLLEEGEEEVKRQLQEEVNSLLTLGQVGAFYFSEYTFLD